VGLQVAREAPEAPAQPTGAIGARPTRASRNGFISCLRSRRSRCLASGDGCGRVGGRKPDQSGRRRPGTTRAATGFTRWRSTWMRRARRSAGCCAPGTPAPTPPMIMWRCWTGRWRRSRPSTPAALTRRSLLVRRSRVAAIALPWRRTAPFLWRASRRPRLLRHASERRLRPDRTHAPGDSRAEVENSVAHAAPALPESIRGRGRPCGRRENGRGFGGRPVTPRV